MSNFGQNTATAQQLLATSLTAGVEPVDGTPAGDLCRPTATTVAPPAISVSGFNQNMGNLLRDATFFGLQASEEQRWLPQQQQHPSDVPIIEGRHSHQRFYGILPFQRQILHFDGSGEVNGVGGGGGLSLKGSTHLPARSKNIADGIEDYDGSMEDSSCDISLTMSPEDSQNELDKNQAGKREREGKEE